MKHAQRTFSVIFVCLFLLLLFTGCANRQPNGLAIVDGGGVTRVIATNADGEPATDENGNLLEYQTDKNGGVQKDEAGQALTQAISAPNVYQYKGKISCDLFTFQIPQGWEGKASPQIRLTQNEGGATLELQALHNMSLERFLEFADAFFPKQDANGNKLREPAVSDCSYAGLSGKKLEMTFSTDEGDLRYSALALMHKEHLIAFYLNCPKNQNPQPDWEAIASHLQVKP